MKYRVAVLASLLGVLIAQPLQSAAGERISLELSRRIMSSPGRLTARVFIERDEVNRALEIVAESPVFYRSSLIPIDGDRAPRVTEVTFKGLPVGEYVVAAVLHDELGNRSTSRVTAIVLSMGER
jgi:hypothetical protein